MAAEFHLRTHVAYSNRAELKEQRPPWFVDAIAYEFKRANGTIPKWLSDSHDCWLLQDMDCRRSRWHTECMFFRDELLQRVAAGEIKPHSSFMPHLKDFSSRTVTFKMIQEPPRLIGQNDKTESLPPVGDYKKFYSGEQKICPVVEVYKTQFKGKEGTKKRQQMNKALMRDGNYKHGWVGIKTATVDMIDNIDDEEGDLFLFETSMDRAWRKWAKKKGAADSKLPWETS